VQLCCPATVIKEREALTFLYTYKAASLPIEFLNASSDRSSIYAHVSGFMSMGNKVIIIGAGVSGRAAARTYVDDPCLTRLLKSV
jgi:hypothetical protein